MKITLQTIKQVKYEVDISYESSVLELKKLIEANHGFDHTVMKLLLKGKILEDNKLLNEYQFSDSTPVIIMNVKAKAQNVSIPIENSSLNEENKKDDINKPFISNNPNNNLPFSKTKDYSKEIKQLKEMGFDNEQSETAIKSAKGNLILALEYIYNGNPLTGNYQGEEEDEEYGLGPEDEEGEEDEEDIMGEDLDTYEIEDIASVIKVISKNDPSQLQTILTNLESQNPDLYDIISQNEEEFKVLVSQPITPKDQQVYDNFIKKNEGSLIGLIGNLTGSNHNNDNNNNLNSESSYNLKNTLTSQDLEVIQRLKNLGFNEEECIEAYLACGKDENLAASFLFENKN